MLVGLFVGVLVEVLVGVIVGVFEGVTVGVAEGVLVGVLEGVDVGVTVRVFVGVLVGVAVGVLVGSGVPRDATTSPFESPDRFHTDKTSDDELDDTSEEIDCGPPRLLTSVEVPQLV